MTRGCEERITIHISRDTEDKTLCYIVIALLAVYVGFNAPRFVGLLLANFLAMLLPQAAIIIMQIIASMHGTKKIKDMKFVFSK